MGHSYDIQEDRIRPVLLDFLKTSNMIFEDWCYIQVQCHVVTEFTSYGYSSIDWEWLLIIQPDPVQFLIYICLEEM